MTTGYAVKTVTPVFKQAPATAETMRAMVLRLESEIRDNCEQVDLPVKNHFSKGVYARELFIPKGTVLTGKIHKEENLNIITKGDISVLTEEGIKRVGAGAVIVSPPGTKRAGYAHEDTIWITIHGTDERDVNKIEQRFIAQSYEEYVLFCETTLKLEGE
jgi:quercetin dioxygenase-like cupin family protein